MSFAFPWETLSFKCYPFCRHQSQATPPTRKILILMMCFSKIVRSPGFEFKYLCFDSVLFNFHLNCNCFCYERRSKFSARACGGEQTCEAVCVCVKWKIGSIKHSIKVLLLLITHNVFILYITLYNVHLLGERQSAQHAHGVCVCTNLNNFNYFWFQHF